MLQLRAKNQKSSTELFIELEKHHFKLILGTYGPKYLKEDYFLKLRASLIFKLDDILTLCKKIRKLLRVVCEQNCKQTDKQTDEGYFIGRSL